MSNECDRAALIKKACERLQEITPLRQADCGELCGKACCGGRESVGMELVPGEELLMKGIDGFQVVSDGGRNILLCGGICHRDKRPFACRIFPLVPIWEECRFQVVFDPGSASMCPLQGQDDYLGDFRMAVSEAVGLLSSDTEIHHWFLEKSAFLSEMRELVKKLG